jgi:D-alanyl-lipoteichoic acid acyltransferase DltB (MBOAT superfamily)
VSTAFLLLVFPSNLLLVARAHWSGSSDDNDFVALISAIASFLRYISYSVNLLLFCVSSDIFKAELKHLTSDDDDAQLLTEECNCIEEADVQYV